MKRAAEEVHGEKALEIPDVPIPQTTE